MKGRRISVAGIARNGQRLFIARRKPGGDLGGKWEFPGGKVEDGESCEDAVRREYLEEFAVTVEVGALAATASFTHGDAVFALRAYCIFFDESSLKNITLKEHSQWRWAEFDEITALDFAESDKALLPGLEAYFKEQRRFEQ